MNSASKEAPLISGRRSSRGFGVQADETIAEEMRNGQFLGHMKDVRYDKAVVRTGVGTDLHLISDAARMAVSTVRGATSHLGRRFGLS